MLKENLEVMYLHIRHTKNIILPESITLGVYNLEITFLSAKICSKN